MFLKSISSSILSKNRWIKRLRFLSGYSAVADNKIGLAGIVGRRVENHPIEYVAGGAFFAKREFLFKGLSTTLFDLFERKMGGGEDRLIGLALSRQGIVWAHPKIYFYHNDQGDSVYTVNHYRFNKRVAYSRLFLSCEYARLKQQSILVAFMHYQWYSLWRLAGFITNYVHKPRQAKFMQIKGYIAGVFLATFKLAPRYFLKRENNTRDYWNRMATSDLQASKQYTLS